MRISFVNSFPVKIVEGQPESGHWSMAGIPGTTQREEDAAFRMALKRIKVWYSAVTPLGYKAHGWRVAYANPFIHGSFVNWYHDDATYDRTAARKAETMALYADVDGYLATVEPVKRYETIGLSVIEAED